MIYPGLGLGTILSGSKTMTDKMIVAGAHRLSELAPALKDPDQALLPPFGGESSDERICMADSLMTRRRRCKL